MATIVVFHHALGVTPGVRSFARQLSEAGHDVRTPDLYDGRHFEAIEDGVAHAETLGFESIAERGRALVAAIPGPTFVIGFSLGVLPAQKAAQTVDGVPGAVLCLSALPPDMFADGWPTGVRLQVHLVEDDPWSIEDLPAARELVDAADGELFLHPGDGHLVIDDAHVDHDPVVARTIVEEIRRFLDPSGIEAGRR